MNKNTEFNQALKISRDKSNNGDKTMSCEEDTSQVTKKRKSMLLNTPRYVFMSTRDVKDLVRSRLYLVYSKYTDKMAVGIKDFITCIGGRTTQHHCFAFMYRKKTLIDKVQGVARCCVCWAIVRIACRKK